MYIYTDAPKVSVTKRPAGLLDYGSNMYQLMILDSSLILLAWKAVATKHLRVLIDLQMDGNLVTCVLYIW